jgi:glycosyltransferase involved in cell wall biosynthesis
MNGKRVLDLSRAPALGPDLLREAGNHVDLQPAPGAPYDAVLSLQGFGASEDPRQSLSRLPSLLASGATFVVAAPLGERTDSGTFRFETLVKLLHDYFRVVTYAFVHGEAFRTEWDQYSARVILFCRHLKPVAQSPANPIALDTLYGGTARGMLPFSLDYVRGWFREVPPATAPPRGRLLFFLQPLPLYNDPLVYQRFLERYLLLGRQYRELGWDVSYSTTAELKSLYGLAQAFAPEDFGYAPPLPDWRRTYSKSLSPDCPLDDPDLQFWADYTRWVLDRARPDAIFAWNKNTLLDRIAAERGVAVIHNELGLDRAPRPVTYYFDPQGINAESSLRRVWERYRHFHLPPCCQELVDLYRSLYLEPWLGPVARTETLESLGLDPARRTVLIPMQVENDSNVLGNSPFRSMVEFCETVQRGIPEGEWNVIVKPHPADPAPHTQLPADLRGVRVVAAQHPTGPLLKAADVVCTISSTTGYEALLAGKQVVTFGSSAFSGLGFSADSTQPFSLPEALASHPVPSQTDVDRFLFVASIFYPASEERMSEARLQEPWLLRALDRSQEFWPDPDRVDWQSICSERKTEWLRGARIHANPTEFPSHAPELQEAVGRLESRVGELEQQNASLARSLDSHQQELREAQRNATFVGNRNVELKSVLGVVTQLHASASADLHTTRERLLEAASHVERLRRKVDGSEQEALWLASELAQQSVRRAALSSELHREWARSRQYADLLASERERTRQLESAAGEYAAELERARGARRYFEDELNKRDARERAQAAGGKGLLHALLDVGQALTPGFVRSSVRPFYLNHFYYRMFPHRRPDFAPPRAIAAAPEQPSTPPVPKHSPEALGSSYPPYVEYKQQMHLGLPLELPSVASGEVPGLVSVVLPVYNGAAFVRESIESVLRQSYANLELIVVNDGSTDETPLILENYEHEPRVRVIHQENRKLPGALNAGFDHCSGEFWTWTSADNIMFPAMLAKLVAFLQKRPDVQTVYANELLIDETGREARDSDFCPGYQSPAGSGRICFPRDPGELSFVQNNYVGGCFLYRAWAAKLIGPYDECAFGYEDYDFWMRMNDLFRLAHLGEDGPLYRYRLHHRSLTSRDKELRITERVRHFMEFAAERRNFFARPFDITFFGTHPWFAGMADAYKKAGHNVFEARAFDETARYRFEVTRAFEKAIAVFGEQAEPEALAAARKSRCIVVQLAPEATAQPDLHISLKPGSPQPGFLSVRSFREALYPMLAGANSLVHARTFAHPEADRESAAHV